MTLIQRMDMPYSQREAHGIRTYTLTFSNEEKRNEKNFVHLARIYSVRRELFNQIPSVLIF